MNPAGQTPCDKVAILHGTPCAGAQARGQRWTLAAAILGSGMAFIDGSIVNVALPAIQRELGASAAQLQWIVEAYALFLASLLLAGGALGDRLGRRRIFMAGVALFTGASAACALSPSADLLIAARAVQGIGAALLVPGSLSLIGANFTQADRGRAIGTWSALSGVAAAIGPVLGGWLVEHYRWTWAFLVNLPLGAALLLICATRVPESRNTADTSAIDLPGASLATLGLAGVVFALVQAPLHGWRSADVLAALAIGVAGLAAFIRVEARSAAPMVPLRLFRIGDFAGANLLTLLLYAALGGGLYFLPLNLIQVQGYGAAAAGAAMLPFIAIMFALSRAAGHLVDRTGPRLPLIVGPLVAAVGFALFMLPGVGSGYWAGFFPATVVLGLGMAITVAPLTTTVMNAVGAEAAGVASGVNNAVSRAAGLLAIAGFGVLMAQGFNHQLAESLQALSLPPGVADAIRQQQDRLAGIALPDGLDAALKPALQHAIGSAFVAGFRLVMAVCAALALLSGLSAAWMIGRERPA
ncbi:DHA2 family efflux MFS transporter permease subunit [Rhizobacter sp. SG703]|uniref:DHA2 family efflux MFS transporter permease subunit n=1 Tax=Rhizobacter sp. SG703 TaxID=2587140 RepID=UPI001445744C|nr:DHA2 family efflux MFS transporter permease subunit [Rhizobacter sp. SG703]NKI94877.1 EmrB/QacA subfamily drug resistance transporter [Rhizobacter sp. SG703]